MGMWEIPKDGFVGIELMGDQRTWARTAGCSTARRECAPSSGDAWRRSGRGTPAGRAPEAPKLAGARHLEE